MSIDQVPEHQSSSLATSRLSNPSAVFVVAFIALALLALGEIYTWHRIGSLRASLGAQQARIEKANASEISDRFSALQRSNARDLEAIKQEIDTTSKRGVTTGKALGRARSMVTQLQKDQAKQADFFKEEISKKADQQQVLALTQDVSTTKTDLDSTKKGLSSLAQDLGMARSDLGTLIARNHDEIEQLRKLGERDYIEFTLERKHPQRIGNVGLDLKRTNVKRHKFTLALTADDVQVEKKDRTQNEPIFFYVGGSKKPYELVVNKVQSGQVVGYISTPKGAMQEQVASSSQGKS